MYVGTLTTDEMSFAGATGSPNSTHYLINNYAKSNSLIWWGLSPYFFDAGSGYDFVILLKLNGLLYDDRVDSYFYSRPAVTLLSSTQITGGNGTISNPYTVS